jgi:hypothetical protein
MALVKTSKIAADQPLEANIVIATAAGLFGVFEVDRFGDWVDLCACRTARTAVIQLLLAARPTIRGPSPTPSSHSSIDRALPGAVV